MTNHWVDIKNADVVLVMGGNAAEAHPCGFKWVIEAKAQNKARLIVVDPRFTRTAAVADYYAPIRPGTDIAFLGGVINYLLDQRQDPARVRQGLHQRHLPACARTTASRTASSPATTRTSASYDKTTWAYQLDKDGFAKVDPTLQDPRCVFKLMKRALRALHAGDGRAASPARRKDQFLEDLRA